MALFFLQKKIYPAGMPKLSKRQQIFEGDLEEFLAKYAHALDIDFKQYRCGGFSAKLYWPNGKTTKVSIKHSNETKIRPIPYIDRDQDMIYKALCKEFHWLKDLHRRVNLYGLVQSGKGRAMMAILWCSIYQWRLRPYYFCLNMVKSYNQIIMRDIGDFNTWLESLGETERTLKINGLRGAGSNRNDPTCITLLMNNKYQQQKIHQDTTPYMIVGDEGDTLIKHWDSIQDTSTTGRYFHEFETHSKSTWMVTATPMALLNEKGVLSQSFELPISKLYRGVEAFQKHFLTDEEHKSLAKDNTLLVPVVQRVITACNVEGKWPYSSILINTRHLRNDHKEIARSLQKTGISSYIVNSDGINYYKASGGVEQMNFTNVYALYNYFEELYRQDGIYRAHIIIAKRAANRAISFRPQPGKGNGGLIGQILLPTNNGASRVQELRMCGNYSPNYPTQHLFMSRNDYENLRDEVIYNIPNMVQANKIPGESRLQIEGVSVIANGPHDRPNVDDTTLENRHALNKTEFDRLDEGIKFCHQMGFATHAFTMTETKLLQVPLLDAEKTILQGSPTRSQKDQIRNRVEQILGIQGGGFNVGWGSDRLENLLRMTWRFDSNNAWAPSKYVAAISKDGQSMNITQWKDVFFEPDTAEVKRPRTRKDRTIDYETCFPENVAFFFLNPHGKWMYFVRNDRRVIGTLAHRTQDQF